MSEDRYVIDASVPRICYYRTFSGHPGACPRCGGTLRESYQTYLVATRRGRRDTGEFMMGSDDVGWYCTACPAVVVNLDEMGEMLQHAMARWDTGSEFAILGLVDLQAVPPAKQHLPLGGDDNPIPFVEFTFPEAAPGPQPSRPRSKVKRRR